MKISVIIPVFNEEKVIKKTIKSVLNSTFDDFELIIVDNGSTDSTIKVIKSIKSKKIKLFTYTKKKGPAPARNYGARMAKGEILFFLDADELMTKSALKNTADLFNKYSPDGICYNRKVILPKNWTRIWVYKFTDQWGIFNGTYFANKVDNCPYIFKRTVFNKLKGFPETVYYFEDLILMRKLQNQNLRVLLTNKIRVKSDMGASFNDFFKRSKNIGVGVVKSGLKLSVIKNLLITFFLLLSMFFPIIYLVFFLYYGLHWFRKTNDLLIMLTSPFLFTIDKLTVSYYIIKELI